MKKNALFIFILSLTLVSSVNSKSTLKEESFLLSANLRVLSQYHFFKKSINEQLFSEIFTHYLKEVDRYKIFLTAGDVKELEKLKIPKNNLDELLALPAQTKVFLQQRIPMLQTELEQFFATPLDFSKEEYFNSDYKTLPYSQTEAELIERWHQRLKYQTLSQALIKFLPDTNFSQPTANLDNNNSSAAKPAPRDDNDRSDDADTASTNFAAAVKDVQTDVMNSTKRLFATLENLTQKDYLDYYLTAIGQTYDEYTTYLPPVQKETFDIRLSGQLEGIGAEIRKDPIGLVEVVRIVPGGASYRQKELQAGDRIMRVAQSEGKFIDVQNIALNEVLSLIRGKKGTLVKLTVKKESGEIVIIPIVRDKIILEETYARSAILSHQQKDYGYIYLPKFYRNFNDTNERSSSGDVRRALNNLNEQNIEGLIFDLRNNGGGSLEDAIQMSGLFISQGPIIRVRDNSREYPAYKDEDPAIVFSAPVVVLINGSSASASEIFSAALQDYKRALIIGVGAQSFGKGTVQTLFSLNKLPEAASFGNDLGYLKFTIQKYYRITGESTQTRGVRPDIILPNLTIPLKQESAFTNDSLGPTIFNKWANFRYPIPELVVASEKRISANPTFQNIVKRSVLIQTRQNQTRFPLQYATALSEREQYLKTLAQFKVDLSQPLNFNAKATPLSPVERAQSGAEERLLQQEQWQNDLTRDLYLQETLAILVDILNA